MDKNAPTPVARLAEAEMIAAVSNESKLYISGLANGMKHMEREPERPLNRRQRRARKAQLRKVMR